MSAYAQVLLEMRQEFPDFEIVPKSESRLMRAIDVILRIITFGQMKAFMTGFITTLGTTVYVHGPWTDSSDNSKAIVLRHERVHMRQARRYTRPLFSLLYLFVLPSVWTFRARFEKEAYEETMAAVAEIYGPEALNPDLKEGLVGHFTSAEYFWMDPFRRSVERWYDETRDRILSRSEE